MQKRSSFNEIASKISLGAAAFAVGMPTTQAAAEEPYVVTADGGITFSDFSEALFDEKGGLVPDVDRDLGFYGSVAVSKKISDTWDWRVSGSLFGFGDNTVSVRSGPDAVSFSQDLTGLTADADFGWLTTMGETNLRFGVGLLATSYDKGIDFGVTDGVLVAGGDFNVEYSGIGPKLSVDLVHPVSADGRTKLIGGASVAPTTGDFDFSTSQTPPGGPRETFSDSADGDALLSAAYLGLSMQRGDTAEWRMGLRLDNIDTDIDGSSGDGIGLVNDSILTTTVFVGLKIQF